MADPGGACRVRLDLDLSVWPEPCRTAMAMDHLGQCLCRYRVARRFGPILLVCREFWEFQQDLWFARCGYRVYDVDVAVDNRRSGRRQA